MSRQPRSTVAPRPYSDLELVELEETARACGKIVRLVFEDGSVIEREDHIGIDRAMAIAFCRDIVTLRAERDALQRIVGQANVARVVRETWGMEPGEAAKTYAAELAAARIRLATIVPDGGCGCGTCEQLRDLAKLEANRG